MPRLLPLLVVGTIAGAGVFWVVTRPSPIADTALMPLTGDAGEGEQVFNAAGCASCHMAEGAGRDQRLVLSGGRKFVSPFGTFSAPNISTDATHGIGGWTLRQFANAVTRGIAPDGSHLYPALPYPTYIRMEPQDIANLYAYMQTLPTDATPNQPHDIGFPFNIRRLVGGWNLLFLDHDWVVTGDLTPEEARGRYLVEALGHCGECHTPRNALGGPDRGQWLAGAPNPAGQGRIPNITPAALDWSQDEIVEYLTTGTTPDFDSVGGEMSAVVDNLALLPETDRVAIAAYLKKVPSIAPAP